jgi:oxygen-independent coproporphyrinogen-3 oxidase
MTYIENITKGVLPVEKEELDAIQQLNEYIMTSLRTIEGLDLNNMSTTASSHLLDVSRKFLENDLMKIENDHLVLTREGKLLADGIAADLFF